MNIKYKKIIIVAGTRPNFVKAAPLLRAFKALPKNRRPQVLLLHTGQHYDHQMSRVFFRDLEIPRPDIFLNVRARTPAGQTDEIIASFQLVLAVQRPDLVMVVGDVTGTLACALAARMSGIEVAHVEAGLRSYDDTMPEERNRVLTDHVSDLLFTSCPEALGNLLKEGVARNRIHFAGNVMIDSLKAELHKAEGRKLLSRLGLQKGKEILSYVLLTLHRPSNVDDPRVLGPLLKAFQKIAKEVAVVFPAHPRTRQNLKLKIKNKKSKTKKGEIGLKIIPPLGYLDFIALQQHALCVFTDSGGVQEETSFLKVPCFTVRNNTERPVTVELGTNRIIGTKPGAVLKAWGNFKMQKWEMGNIQIGNGKAEGKKQKRKTDNGKRKTGIPKWDGHAAERIVGTIISEQ